MRILLSIMLYVFFLIGGYCILEKMGEKGWKFLIPIYGQYILVKNIWCASGFWAICFTSLVAWGCGYSLIGIIAVTVLVGLLAGVCAEMAQRFGKGEGYALGLFFLEPIFMLILGLGKCQYRVQYSNR